MSLIKQEINEIRGMIQDFKAGKMSADNLQAAMSAYGQVEKRIGHLLKGIAIATQAQKKNGILVLQTGLIGDERILEVSLEEAASQQVLCESMNKVISREECKHRSGDSKFFDSCQGCDRNKTTRSLVTNRMSS